jgi:hypothetical protein
MTKSSFFINIANDINFIVTVFLYRLKMKNKTIAYR